MMRSILLALALTLPGVALAVAPPAKPATSPDTVSVQVKRVVMSPAGMAKVKQMSAVPDARLQQLVAEQQGLVRQKVQFVAGGPIDMAKFEALLRREESITAEARKLQNDRLLTMMRALSESDRIALLQTAAFRNAKPQGQTAPAAPASSGR